MTLLQAAYERFKEGAAWPRVDELQHEFDLAGEDLDVDGVGETLDRRYAWLGRGSNETLELTLCGVALCQGADADLADVLVVGRLAYSRYLEHGAGATIQSVEVAPSLDNDDLRLRKVLELVRWLPGFGGGTSAPDHWTRQLTRDIRVWKDVSTTEQFIGLAPCSSAIAHDVPVLVRDPTHVGAVYEGVQGQASLGVVDRAPKPYARGSFSSREAGWPPAVAEEMSDAAWGGLVAIIRSFDSANAFALAYPVGCDDNPSNTVGTDRQTLGLAIADHAPSLTWPADPRETPPTTVVMDLIEFLHSQVAEARERDGGWHPFFKHYHLELDRVDGQRAYREQVNELFWRHGLAFELQDSGRVERLGSPVTRAQGSRLPPSGDASLDGRLARALDLYASADVADRLHGLRELWDCFERLKTLEHPENKKASVGALIRRAVGETPMFDIVEAETTVLTSIGNEFDIRHAEIGKHQLSDPAHLDYLFGRLFNVVWLFLRSRVPPAT